MPQTCQTCHTTAAWQPATFDHNQVGFPLTGGHRILQCNQCHTNGNFNLTTKACVSCHLKDYQNTNNPNHVQRGFPQSCEVCHSTAAWIPAQFNHAASGFPLTGAHAGLQCSQCHINNNYNLTSTACVSCHLKDFQGTTNPNHISSGFPQQCQVCHSTTAWIPASFNHNNTPFPLTGAHGTVPCASCHVNNNYTTLPTDCYSCHKADYNGTTNPNHVAAGFPTTCTTCHNTTAWIPANFNHTYFPMNHGGANGVCATCHTNSNNYAVFTCTNCHTKPNTDQRHQGVGGYVYNSINCYQCHQSPGGGG
jgi:predicted CXXCH cytochrome family protein